MSIDLKQLSMKEKVELFNKLYSDITDHGKNGDVHLSHINEYERKLLIAHGGCGTVNDETGLTQLQLLLVKLQKLKQENLPCLIAQPHWHNNLETYLLIK